MTGAPTAARRRLADAQAMHGQRSATAAFTTEHYAAALELVQRAEREMREASAALEESTALVLSCLLDIQRGTAPRALVAV